MKFAKLFDTAHNGQILVFVGFGQMGEPCMNILSSMDDSPEIQHARTSYPADAPIEDAIAGIHAMFNEIDEAKAIALVTAYSAQSAGPFPAIVADEDWHSIDVTTDANIQCDRVDLMHADGTVRADVPANDVDWCAFGGVIAWRPHTGARFPSLSSLATHRCTICHALWRYCPASETGFDTDTWSLKSPKCGPCCDNVEMGDQIVPLDPFVSEGGETD